MVSRIVDMLFWTKKKKNESHWINMKWEKFAGKSSIFSSYLLNISLKHDDIELKIFFYLFRWSVDIFSKFQLIWTFLDRNRFLKGRRGSLNEEHQTQWFASNKTWFMVVNFIRWSNSISESMHLSTSRTVWLFNDVK